MECQSAGFLTIIKAIKTVFNLMCTIVPIILILILSIELGKLVISPDKQKEEMRKIVSKIIAAVCVFFAPVFVNFIISLIGMANVQETACWQNANSAEIAKFRAIEKANMELAQERENQKAIELQQQIDKRNEEDLRILRENEAQRKAQQNVNNNVGASNNGLTEVGSGYGGSNNCNGKYLGAKYSLTDNQVTQLARMVYAEFGGHLVGMKAVASHMANLYEIRKYNGATSKGFFDYIVSCGWYASARIRNNSSYNSSMAKQAVTDVLINGNRTLPLYIDEFDLFPGDIRGAKSVSSYVSGVSKLNNIYGASGTYYCITKTSYDANIFFYTSIGERYKKNKGY